jgi:hypothetical protein
MTATTARPGTVTAAFVILFIYAILSVIGYAIVFVVALVIAPAGGVLGTAGIVALLVIAIPFLLALIQLLVAFAVRNGSNWARVLVIVLSILSIASQVLSITRNDGTTGAGWFGLIVNTIVVVLLLSKSANRYFAR